MKNGCCAHSSVILVFIFLTVAQLRKCGWGLGGFSRVVATFNHVGRSFDLFYGHHWACLNNPTFSNLGLCAVCWAHFICHHELWPTSVGHPFSFLNSFWGLTGGKHHQKITLAIFRFVLQNLLFPVTFLYSFYTPYFNQVERGYTGYTLSICLSICLSVRPSVDKIVSTLYLPQYLLDPFHIYTSYQTTSEVVSHVKVIAKF